jgi:hypothetical protein
MHKEGKLYETPKEFYKTYFDLSEDENERLIIMEIYNNLDIIKYSDYLLKKIINE